MSGAAQPADALDHDAEPLHTPPDIDARVLTRLGRYGAEPRYVLTDDGAVINYKRFGTSAHPIAFCNGLGGTYRTFVDLFAGLVPDFSVLVHDYRGLFESAVAGNPASQGVASHARDLLAVLRHANVGPLPLFGWSMGVQVALEAYRLAPEQFSALILSSGVPGHVLDTALLQTPLAHRVPDAVRLARHLGSGWMHVAAQGIRHPAIRSVARRLRLVGKNGDIPIEHVAWALDEHDRRFWTLMEELQAHDASDVLGGITVPTLVIHGERDVLTPLARGRELRDRIPGAELWVVPGATHAVIVEEPEQLASRIRSFLGRL